MKNNSCFHVEKMSFGYGEKAVLKELSLDIPKGKVTTIIGANGCGKSTFFQLLTKNLDPNMGKITLEGRELQAFSLNEFSKKVAIVHQNHIAPDDMTVSRLVSFGRMPYTRFGRALDPAKDEEMIARAMKITGLEKLKHRTLQSLSGGQRQRAWIAMALAQETEILLLDEPTTYLDVRYQLQILRMVRRLNEKAGMSIIMVLHDINQALYYSDEIIALSPRGKLSAQGGPKEVINSELIKEIYGIDLETMDYQGRKIVMAV